MRRVEASALVGATRQDVWKLLEDIPGMPRWVPYCESIDCAGGPSRVGTLYRERTRLIGVRGTTEWEIIERRVPRHQVRRTVGGDVERRVTTTLEQRGTGTLLTQAMEIRSSQPWPQRWLQELAAVMIARLAVRSAVAGAKRAFEGQPGR
jgi:carbon monoxide dehydrogenase subunit G